MPFYFTINLQGIHKAGTIASEHTYTNIKKLPVYPIFLPPDILNLNRP
jgi:hypothetical protein